MPQLNIGVKRNTNINHLAGLFLLIPNYNIWTIVRYFVAVEIAWSHHISVSPIFVTLGGSEGVVFLSASPSYPTSAVISEYVIYI